MISILKTPDKTKSGKVLGYTLRAYMVGRAHPFACYLSAPNRNDPHWQFSVFNTVYQAKTLDAAIEAFAKVATPALIVAVQ